MKPVLTHRPSPSSSLPGTQKKLRDEIRATRAAARVRGKIDLEYLDCEGMAYLDAFIKVCRFHSHTLDTN